MKITKWRKSSYTPNGSGNCVEVGLGPGLVGVRDTQNRTQGHFTVSRTAWAAFVRSVTR